MARWLLSLLGMGSRKSWLFSLSIGVAACGGEEPSSAPTPEGANPCEEGATSYREAEAECESCECVGGAWRCEQRACFRPECPAQPSCVDSSTKTSWARDPQNGSCCRYELSCIPQGWEYFGSSQVACESQLCRPGDVIPAGDGCNECTCNAAGDLWECSDTSCSADTPEPGDACGFFEGGCLDGQYCAFDPIEACSSTDAPSVCRAIPEECTAEEAPVCACNGQTYGNRCLAAQAGSGIREVGACETSGQSPGPCGAELDSCGPEHYCPFTEDDECGSDGGTLTCRPRPTRCVESSSPVCGCDGRVYGNACLAAQAGVGVAQPGDCP